MKSFRRMGRYLLYLGLLPLAASAGPLEDLQPGQWYEVPNSKLEGVKPDPPPPGNSGISAVTDAWSGGAFDNKRDRLIVWGGGHSDYSGNEIYAFDVNALKWMRLTDPSVDVAGVESSGVYPDGKPRSRHTYNTIQFVPAIDRFCVFGAGGLYPSGQTGSARSDCFDFASGLWERKADAKTYGTANFSAVDPVTGAVWSGKGTLTRWDAVADVWGKQTEYDNDIEWTNYLTMDVDPKRRLMIAVGAGKVYQWNISNAEADTIAVQALATTGGDTVVSQGAPGLAYDPVTETMVAWAGGPDVYSLNPDTRIWTRHARTGGAMPTAAVGNGTYGRFRYVASKNVFILVNQTSDNVFFFKLSDGVGVSIRKKTQAPKVRVSNARLRFNPQVHFKQNRDSRGRAQP